MKLKNLKKLNKIKYPLWRESEEKKKEFILENLNLLEECQIDAIYLDVQDKFNENI